MEKSIQDQEDPGVQKILLGFWVEESLGMQVKDAAWRQRKSLSELLRDYCRAGLRHETSIKGHTHEREG